MAQALAEPGIVRHGFSHVSTSNHGFGRISGMAATARGNVIICDNLENQLILLDSNGQYLSHIRTEHKPWDICVDNKSISYVTFPSAEKVEMFYSDKLLSGGILLPNSSPGQFSRHVAISYCTEKDGIVIALTLSKRHESNLKDFHHYNTTLDCRYISEGARIKTPEVIVKPYVSKLHAGKPLVEYTGRRRERHITYFCSETRDTVDYLVFYDLQTNPDDIRSIAIPTLQEPSDIGSDDHGHVYVSGQYSNNIHRLTDEGSVVDIPLTDRHDIKHPVAMCFSRDCSKFYVANDWGKSVLVYNVV